MKFYVDSLSLTARQCPSGGQRRAIPPPDLRQYIFSVAVMQRKACEPDRDDGWEIEQTAVCVERVAVPVDVCCKATLMPTLQMADHVLFPNSR